MKVGAAFAVLCAAAGLSAAAPLRALTLDEAMAAALASNPSLRAAEEQQHAADARVGQATGAMLPTLALAASYGAARLDPKGYFGLLAEDVHPRAIVATIEQPLFAGGRILAERAAAVAAADGAAAATELRRASLRADVAAGFAATIVAKGEIGLRQRQLAELAETRRQADLRFRAGEAPSTAVSQADARLAEAEAGLAAARAAHAAAMARFAALSGLAFDGAGAMPPPPAAPATQDEAVARALKSSPALAASAHAAVAASAEVRAATAGWLPSVGAFAEASSVRDQFFPGYAADEKAVGVRARWVLFDRARDKRVVEARARARAADAERQATRRRIEADTIAAFAQLAAARGMKEAGARRIVAAQEALRSTRLEVATGEKPELALLDAEREALDAEVQALRAEGMVLAAGWQLRELMGD